MDDHSEDNGGAVTNRNLEQRALEADLIARGWRKEFSTIAWRVKEFVDLYQAMGLEVLVVDGAASAQYDPSCDDCTLVGYFKTVFTRKRAS